jgi:hypothetical protein
MLYFPLLQFFTLLQFLNFEFLNFFGRVGKAIAIPRSFAQEGLSTYNQPVP